jgi:hypothetical protein
VSKPTPDHQFRRTPAPKAAPPILPPEDHGPMEMAIALRGMADKADQLAQAEGAQVDGAVNLQASEVRAVAEVLDNQHGIIGQMRTVMRDTGGSMAALTRQLSNMAIVLRLMRLYTLNAIKMPDDKQVRDYLRAYIDHAHQTNEWLAVEWPTDLSVVSKFLLESGYINVNGMVTDPKLSKEVEAVDGR